MNLKLTTELVPKPLWHINTRKLMKKSAWDKLRKELYARQNHLCGICGSAGRLEAHEVWSYDDEGYVQRLVGFIALCPPCHQIKHLGRTQEVAAQGLIDMAEVVAHFMRVNGCSYEDFEVHRREVFETWRMRSAHRSWALDWGSYEHLLGAKA